MDASVGAARYDTGKPMVSLIPSEAILEEAKVFTFGAQKYAAHNWRLGMDYSRVLSSAMRHMLAITAGEDVDAESGCLHAAHVRANMAFLIGYMAQRGGNDDRYKGACP